MNRATSLHKIHKANAGRSCVFTQAMERLDQVEPAIVHTTSHDAQSYALAYVEHYRGNVPQLEREREFLLAALAQAWQREKYTIVVRLMTGVAYLAGRLGNNAEGQRILLWGIDACRQTHDRYHLATFLHRFSELLWSHGQYTQAWQAWEESRAIAGELGRPACLWEPLFSLVYVADILGTHTEVQRFADSFLHTHDADASNSLAVALFVRAFYARLAGNIDKACADLCSCLQPLSTQDSSLPIYKRFFELAVQTELARAGGNYTQSQEYAETTISFARTFCDPYTIAILLIDQAFSAYQHGVLNEAYATIQYLVQLTRSMQAPHLHRATIFYLQHLPEARQEHLTERMTGNAQSKSSLPATSQLLSQRELDILRLVAAGYSNQEIAARLVISVGTTKKHLEHIYEKLDAHSRTQAIAQARELGMLL